MGMFDDLTSKYPGTEDLPYQTKDLDCMMDKYEIRRDGTLWRETYRTEDQSDPNATGFMALAGRFTRVPTGWEQIDHTGWVHFYFYRGSSDHERELPHSVEYRAQFVDGVIKKLEKL